MLLPAGSNVLNMKNDKPLRAGQVFTVSLGVSGLKRTDAADDRSKVYALQVCLAGRTSVMLQPG